MKLLYERRRFEFMYHFTGALLFCTQGIKVGRVSTTCRYKYNSTCIFTLSVKLLCNYVSDKTATVGEELYVGLKKCLTARFLPNWLRPLLKARSERFTCAALLEIINDGEVWMRENWKWLETETGGKMRFFRYCK